MQRVQLTGSLRLRVELVLGGRLRAHRHRLHCELIFTGLGSVHLQITGLKAPVLGGHLGLFNYATICSTEWLLLRGRSDTSAFIDLHGLLLLNRKGIL